MTCLTCLKKLDLPDELSNTTLLRLGRQMPQMFEGLSYDYWKHHFLIYLFKIIKKNLLNSYYMSV